MVANPPEPEDLLHTERVHQGQEEGGADDGGRSVAAGSRPVEPAIQEADPASPGGTPLPGDIPPDAPVVIMIRRDVGEAATALPDADVPGTASYEAWDDVPGHKPLIPELDRRKIAVGFW